VSTSSSSTAAAVAVTASLAAACGPAHVQLATPPPSANVVERAATYEQLRPLGTSTQTDVIMTPNMLLVTQSEFLQLADGTRVYHPDDLEPVVADDSATGRAIRDYRDAKASSRRWRHGTLIAMAAGVAVATVGGIVLSSDEESGVGGALFISGGLVTIFSPLGLLGTIIPEREARDARRTAFFTYDGSLRQAMNLCVDGMRVVDCHAVIPPLVAPTPPAPLTDPPAAAPAPAPDEPTAETPAPPAPAI
jgi:hypothetical protein